MRCVYPVGPGGSFSVEMAGRISRREEGGQAGSVVWRVKDGSGVKGIIPLPAERLKRNRRGNLREWAPRQLVGANLPPSANFREFGRFDQREG